MNAATSAHHGDRTATLFLRCESRTDVSPAFHRILLFAISCEPRGLNHVSPPPRSGRRPPIAVEPVPDGVGGLRDPDAHQWPWRQVGRVGVPVVVEPMTWNLPALPRAFGPSAERATTFLSGPRHFSPFSAAIT